MTYLIGVDVGTSGTKSVLFDEKGNIIGTSSAEYELIQPQNGW
ncbi:MAG: FGGY family carbohydrate kinase, partial [Oscillospiraceae bacterium]